MRKIISLLSATAFENEKLAAIKSEEINVIIFLIFSPFLNIKIIKYVPN